MREILKGKITILASIALFVTAATLLTPYVLAGNPFRGLVDTSNGYPTWDSDIISVRDYLGEDVNYDGEGVYIAVLDTGLAPNWRDYFPQERIATKLGIGFYERLKLDDSCENIVRVDGILHTTSYIGSTASTHGTHVTSTIIGYFYDAPQDTNPPLPPIVVRGIAPKATIIPVKVLDTYYFPCGTGPGGVTIGSDPMVAAGIRYATDLKLSGYSPMIITMSLGGPEPTPLIEDAIDYAIQNGVIVVASAGNEGEAGMGWPGAYPQVISTGASGWIYEWFWPGDLTAPPPPPRYRLWWLQQNTWFPAGYTSGYNDIPEPTPAGDVYITDFSSRENQTLAGLFNNCGPNHTDTCVQDLDVVAPGSWVRGPFPGFPGYAHLPWWSQGIAGLIGVNPGNFYYVGGTSMAAPHVTSVVALMLQKNPTLTQSQVEFLLESTALPIPAGSASVFDIFTITFQTITWGSDADGDGLIQADVALAATP